MKSLLNAYRVLFLVLLLDFLSGGFSNSNLMRDDWKPAPPLTDHPMLRKIQEMKAKAAGRDDSLGAVDPQQVACNGCPDSDGCSKCYFVMGSCFYMDVDDGDECLGGGGTCASGTCNPKDCSVDEDCGSDCGVCTSGKCGVVKGSTCQLYGATGSCKADGSCDLCGAEQECPDYALSCGYCKSLFGTCVVQPGTDGDECYEGAGTCQQGKCSLKSCSTDEDCGSSCASCSNGQCLVSTDSSCEREGFTGTCRSTAVCEVCTEDADCGDDCFSCYNLGCRALSNTECQKGSDAGICIQGQCNDVTECTKETEEGDCGECGSCSEYDICFISGVYYEKTCNLGAGICRSGVCEKKACTANTDCGDPGCGICQEGYCNQFNVGSTCFVSGTCDTNGYCECEEDTDCGENGCGTCMGGLCNLSWSDGSDCTAGGVTGECEASECKVSIANDPIIGGFDGHKFQFDQVGDFALIREGRGWQVNATFSAAPAVMNGDEVKESSWTSAIRVQSPDGDLLSCSIPAVYPNTSLVQMMATPAVEDAILLTPARSVVSLDQIQAQAIVTWKEYAGVEYSYIVGCKITTPLMDIKVYQVSGWEEAQAKPEEHGWAAPFTWLNIDFKMKERLAAPVTGLMGDTYPKEATVHGEEPLQSEAESVVARAKVEGVEGEMKHAHRKLQGTEEPAMLSFSLVGL